MKIADLVNFTSTFMPFQKDYKHRNPGVILKVKGTPVLESIGRTRMSAMVMWSNGDVTTEHVSYLKKVND